MKKKIFNRKGVTLAEMLVAVAILAVFVSMAAVGTSALFGTGEQMMAVSKAAVLGADVMDIITNELRFGEEFSLKNDELHYNSVSYGDNSSMYMDEGMLIIASERSTVGGDGETTSAAVEFKPIGTVAYKEVSLQSLTFGMDDKTGVITVTIEIAGSGKTLWSNKMSIVPFYTKVTT